MDGEFNNFNINNTNITFSVATNNIQTSDELSADPIYQRQMGTNYSRGKKVGKAITIVGISIAFTATAVSAGGVLRNLFVPSPPEVKNPTYVVADGVLSYSFTLNNKLGYKTHYELSKGGTLLLSEDCSEPKDYVVEYSPVSEGEVYKFTIEFTNSFDYRKTIHTNTFKI